MISDAAVSKWRRRRKRRHESEAGKIEANQASLPPSCPYVRLNWLLRERSSRKTQKSKHSGTLAKQKTGEGSDVTSTSAEYS